jgi:hypothetical protein
MGAHFSGDRLPDGSEMTNILAELAGDGVRSVVYELRKSPDAPAERIHYVSDRKVIHSLLADRDRKLSLRHYDRLFAPLDGQVWFLLGNENNQHGSWRLLAEALAIEPTIRRQSTVEIDAIAKANCRSILDAIRSSRRSRFNLIREFGFAVPLQCACAIVGEVPVSSSSLALTLFRLARNLSARRHRQHGGFVKWNSQKATRTGDHLFFWSLLVFGQVFGNFGNRLRLHRIAASHGTRRLADHFDRHVVAREPKASAVSHGLGPTLLVRLNTLRPEDPEAGARHDLAARNLLLEVFASIHFLVGLAFGRILDVLLELDLSLQDFAASLQCEGGEIALDKALSRRTATSMLFRTVRRTVEELGMLPGDALCALIGADHGTELDECAKAELAKWLLDPTAQASDFQFLSFGPREPGPYELSEDGKPSTHDVAHPCFGQFWARAILKAMFIALGEEEAAGRLSIKPVQSAGGRREMRVHDFLSVPDALTMTINRNAL